MSHIRMKYIVAFLIIAGAGLVSAYVVLHGKSEQPKTTKQFWQCAMDHYVTDHPGECPKCHMTLTPVKGDEAKDEKANPDGPPVRIDSALTQNMAIRTGAVTRGPLAKTVLVFGILKLPEPGMHDVTLKIGGRIEKLYADREGMHLAAGERLFDLYSPELQVTAQELISAVKSRKALGADVSPTIRQEAQELVDSARRKLHLWDIAEQDIDAIVNSDTPPGYVTFRSAVTGHVEEKMIVQGSAIQAGMKLMRIADHTKLWLDAQVYQEQLSVIKSGQQVLATVDGIPGKVFKGPITFANPHLDMMTRTLTVRVMLENPGLELRPGMFAKVEIVTQPASNAIQAPREAVIDTGTRQIAFVADGEGHFSPRKVRMGIMGDDDQVEILEGLAPGELVVTSGQFLLDVESRTIEATRKLTAGSSPEAVVAPPPGAGTKPAGESGLTLAHCPMSTGGDWLQKGEVLLNPYMGKRMLHCGSMTKKLPPLAPGSELTPVVKAYLDIALDLAGDQVNTAAIGALSAATNRLPGEKYADLKHSVQIMGNAKGIEEIRHQLVGVSAKLITLVEEATKR